MTKIEAIRRPKKWDGNKDAVDKLGLRGMNVSQIRGHGKQKGHTATYRGKEYDVSLLPKTKVEVVLADHLVDAAVKAIMAAARTGEIGDGRIFVVPISQSYKIRTGETDAA